jgi:phage-related protein
MKMRVEHRQEITSDQILPGDLIDLQYVGVPRYYRLHSIRDCASAQAAVGHLAVEVGRKKARTFMGQLSRRLNRLRRYVARHGCHVAAACDWTRVGSLRATAWICRDRTVRHELVLTPWSAEAVDGGVSIYLSHRADAIWRRLEALRAERLAKQEVKRQAEADAYVASLPADVQALQRTCRATCIRVSADGRTVTETLHDVGGTMTSTVGMATSLADAQARHDAIYHQQEAQ